MAAMMQKRAAFPNRSLSAVSPSTRNLVVTRYAQTLSAGDLAAFKIVDLVDIAKKKGVSGGRDATRDTLTRAILQKGVSMSDLTRGQVAELKAKNPSAGSGSGGYSAPSEGRFSSYSNGTSSGGRSGGSSSGTTLSAGDLSAFKNADLAEIASKKGVTAGRNATRDQLTQGLVRAGVSLNDLTRGQLVDLGIKLGKAGLSRDINRARAELAALIGGSGSAPASWRSTPTPAASSGDRWSSYSRSSSASSGRGGSSSSGAKLSASDLVNLPIDDLRDLVSKVGAELPRAPTKDGVINALVSKGVSLDHLTRGMLVALSTKLGTPLAKDINGLKANLSGRVGGGSSGGGSSWRSTPAPSAAPAYGSSGGDRWAKYSAGSTQNASWRRSGSHNASGSKLSASDLAVLRIDDLRDLVKKTGAELPREPTKEGVVSALLQKAVSLNDLTRGMLVDLANKLGTPLARDVDSLRRNLSSAVGKGSYSHSSPSTSSNSSWRSAPSTPAPASTDRWASYSRGSSNGTGRRPSGPGAVYEADLQGFKIDMLSEMARKIGIPMRNATKDSLVSQLVKSITLADLSRGQLIEILSNINQSTSGSVEDLRSRVAAASSQRQSARGRSLAGARW